MFCENCGAKVQDGAAFCSECGASTAAQPEQSARPVYAQPQPYAAPVSPRRSRAMPSPCTRPSAAQQRAAARGPVHRHAAAHVHPIANIILMFVWAFGSTVNLNKKTTPGQC